MDTRELIHAAATIAAGMVTGTKGQLDPGTIDWNATDWGAATESPGVIPPYAQHRSDIPAISPRRPVECWIISQPFCEQRDLISMTWLRPPFS